MKFVYIGLLFLIGVTHNIGCMKHGLEDEIEQEHKRVRLDGEDMVARQEQGQESLVALSEPVSLEQKPLCVADRALFQALMYSQDGNRERIERALVGANVNACDPEEAGNTPLHMAIVSGLSVDIQQALISAGADVNAVNNYGVSPLMLAADQDQFPAIAQLIRAGADFNAIDPNDGTTILHKVAGAEDGLAMVRGLVVHLGMDYMATDHNGCIPADYARHAGQVPSWSFLLSALYAHRWQDVIQRRAIRRVAEPFLVGTNLLPPVLSGIVCAYL
ncbi:MAG: ankyrin repeat domain-containing protein [Candidatus Dependentiae bacterium]|nr:ankyrin repeat domain-containing protein [Candidatus Dependentiae bacterium]